MISTKLCAVVSGATSAVDSGSGDTYTGVSWVPQYRKYDIYVVSLCIAAEKRISFFLDSR